MSRKLKEIYTLNFSLTTDGDFCLPLIPKDVKYDGDDGYYLTKEFNTVEAAISYCENFLMKSFGFLYCDSESSKEHFIDRLTTNLRYFISSLKVGFNGYAIAYLISGNQVGEITLTQSLQSYDVCYSFTASEWEIVDKAEEFGLNYEYVKESFLKSCLKFIEEKEINNYEKNN